MEEGTKLQAGRVGHWVSQARVGAANVDPEALVVRCPGLDQGHQE